MGNEEQSNEKSPPGERQGSRLVAPSDDDPPVEASELPPTGEQRDLWIEHLRPLLEAHAREFVLAVSARGELLGSSQEAALGYSPEEQGGHHIAETLHPDDLPRVFDVLERARISSDFRESIRVRAKHKDGSWRVLAATVMTAVDEDLGFEGALVRVRDITEDLSPSASLDLDPSAPADVDGRFLSLAEAVPMGILSADARGWVVFTNRAATELFDLDADAMLGSGWTRAVLDEDRDEVEATGREVIRCGTACEVSFRLATGLYQRWVHARFVPLGEGHTTGWIATMDDVTERRHAESRLSHMATHDSLTNLPNRVLLEDRLRQACGRLRRGSHSVSVVFVDLDGFKEVNDQLGHAVGDAVLVETALRLRTAIRDVDTIARLGGDEFVLVCESLSPDEATEVVDRVEAALAPEFRVDGHKLSTAASVGAVTTNEATTEVADLLGRADQAMYRVKHHRRATNAN